MERRVHREVRSGAVSSARHIVYRAWYSDTVIQRYSGKAPSDRAVCGFCLSVSQYCNQEGVTITRTTPIKSHRKKHLFRSLFACSQ
jgi:hypothetical protein